MRAEKHIIKLLPTTEKVLERIMGGLCSGKEMKSPRDISGS